MGNKDTLSRKELRARATQEDQTPDELLDTEQLKRKRDREKKRKQRGEEKEEKAVAQQSAVEQAAVMKMSLREWWGHNRAKLSEAQNAELATRQETVLDTIHWMQAWANGTYTVDPRETDCYVGLKEGTADMEADISEFHTTYCFETPETHAELFRKSPEFRENLKDYGRPLFNDENATQVWLRYGYLVAIPSQRACDFRMATQPKVES